MRRARPNHGGVAEVQRGRTGLSAEYVTKHIDLDNRVAALLVGENDSHLRALEQLLDCDISLRGNQLTLEGSAADVERAEALVHELLALLGSGQDLDRATLELAASLSASQGDWAGDLNNIVSDVILEHRGRRIRPKTKNQKAYVDAIRSNTITFGIGPAGTGKTYLAMAMATAALLSGDVARIILTRPAVEAGEKLGFLPGGLMEKVDPYLRPLFDALYDMMDSDRLTDHLQRGTIEVAPLAYMRGRTLNDSLIILDEAQNTSPEQMKMFLTRLGFGAKNDRHRRHHSDRPAPRAAFGPGAGARRALEDPRHRVRVFRQPGRGPPQTGAGHSLGLQALRRDPPARSASGGAWAGGAPPRRPGRGRGLRVTTAGYKR